MFRYSEDDFIANEQKSEAEDLIEGITKESNLQYSDKIDQLFTEVSADYQYLEQFTKLTEKDDKITMVVVGRSSSLWRAKRELRDHGYIPFSKPITQVIPYIEHSLLEKQEDNCPHGPQFIHAYYFFFTHYNDFESAEQCIIKHLGRINKLKAFL